MRPWDGAILRSGGGTRLWLRARARARRDQLRIEPLRGRELGLRLGGLPELTVQESQVEVGGRVVRVHGDHLLVEREGVGGEPHVRANDREIEESALHLRVLLEREAVISLRGDEPIPALRDLAEVVEGVLVLGVLRERGEVRGDGLVQLARGVCLEAAIQRVSSGLVPAASRASTAGRGKGGQTQEAPDQQSLHSAAMLTAGRTPKSVL